jgi:DNA-directed RNA polymerase specialized sigma24 family protein
MAMADETHELLQRWHGGDREALAALVERDRRWVEDRVRRRRGAALQQLAETNDDFQDLMLRALQYSPRFLCRDRDQFRALLARMLENQLTDRARSLAAKGREIHFDSIADSRLSLDPALAESAQAPRAAAQNEELAWMRLGLEFLEPEERDVIWRRQFLEQGFADIAAADGTQADAVRMRFNRALLRLAGVVQRLQAGKVQELLGADG